MKNAETSVNDVQLVQRLEEHGGVVNSVAFYGNHLIASGSGLVTANFSKSFNEQDTRLGQILFALKIESDNFK